MWLLEAWMLLLLDALILQQALYLVKVLAYQHASWAAKLCSLRPLSSHLSKVFDVDASVAEYGLQDRIHCLLERCRCNAKTVAWKGANDVHASR